MATSILDNLRQIISESAVSGIAERLGENQQNVSRGLNAGATSILAGLANKTGDSNMMRQTFDLISKPGAGVGAAADDVALAREGKPPTELANMSSRFLGDLLGDRASAVNNVISQTSGLRAESASSIMRFAAPIVLGFLGRHVRTGGLDLNSFTQLLSIEKNNIMRAAPPGLASALGVQPAQAPDREVPFQFDRREVEGERVPVRGAEPTHTSARWLWPALATLAVLALIWGVSRGRRVQRIDTTAVAGGEVSQPGIAPPAVSTNQPNSIQLPNGTALAIPAAGTEARFIAFIRDTTQHAGESASFDMDRLTFANNSANLLPQSDDQLRTIATIIKSYPNVAVRVAGYTDNVGSPATNQRLSAQRASAVRAALVKDGVPASQLSAQGYGQKNPEADNSTDQGRAQNRRVALVVLRK
jgi:outer membrane protein OmpA-like peptidoglycan-associated protein